MSSINWKQRLKEFCAGRVTPPIADPSYDYRLDTSKLWEQAKKMALDPSMGVYIVQPDEGRAIKLHDTERYKEMTPEEIYEDICRQVGEKLTRE